MLKVLSKITGGVIPSYRLGAHVSEGPVTNNKLKENLDGRLEKLRSRGEQPMICYEIATHAARAGNTITKNTEKVLSAEKNYSTNYFSLMDTRTFLQNCHRINNRPQLLQVDTEKYFE